MRAEPETHLRLSQYLPVIARKLLRLVRNGLRRSLLDGRDEGPGLVDFLSALESEGPNDESLYRPRAEGGKERYEYSQTGDQRGKWF